MKLLVLSLLVLTALVEFATSKNVVCYYDSWSYYNNGDGKFVAEDINPFLCTHVIYTFAYVYKDGDISSTDTMLDLDLKMMERLNDLKQKNKNLKTLLAIGGRQDYYNPENSESITYSKIAGDSDLRTKFAKTVVTYLTQYGFDGLDIVWDYPAENGGIPADKKNFVTLLRELKGELNNHGLLLSTAVVAFPSDKSYNVPEVADNVDLLNILTFDMHTIFDHKSQTGVNAPLYNSMEGSDKNVTVANAVQTWISKGANPQKINLGLPLYGRSYKLADPESTSIGSPITNEGDPGPYSRMPGTLSYNEICIENGYTERFDQNTRTPYAYLGNLWVSYDNEQSLQEKVKLANDLNLGGVLVWSINNDDFKGTCGQPYPLLNAIVNHLN